MITVLMTLAIGSLVALAARRGVAHRAVFAGIAMLACAGIAVLLPSIPSHEQLASTDWSQVTGGTARAELLHTFGYDVAHVLLGTAIGADVGVAVHRRHDRA